MKGRRQQSWRFIVVLGSRRGLSDLRKTTICCWYNKVSNTAALQLVVGFVHLGRSVLGVWLAGWKMIESKFRLVETLAF